MADYSQIHTHFQGDDRVDTKPSAVGRKGYTRYDTGSRRKFYSNGTIWIEENAIGRRGVYFADVPVGIDATGALEGTVGVGVQSSNWNTAGKFHQWNTRGVINDAAGVLKLDNFTSARYINPVIRFAHVFNPNTSSNRREFMGWGPKRMIDSSDTVPLASNESGILLGHGAADTQWYIYHNDAGGTCVKTPTGANLSATAVNQIYEIIADEAAGAFTVTIYSTLNGVITGIYGTSVTVSTRVPTTNTHLHMQDLLFTSDTSTQSNQIHYIEVYN